MHDRHAKNSNAVQGGLVASSTAEQENPCRVPPSGTTFTGIKIGTLPSTVGPHLIHLTTAYVVRVNKPNGNRWQPLDTKYVNPKTNPFSCGPLCTDMHI